jgi:hypothetical protein
MPQPEFESLRHRLLSAGIAPRHVNRYLGELKDHFDDLVREKIAQGMDRRRAEAEARSRLGEESVLAETMLEQPGMRSFVSRYPWAAFVLGPISMSVVALAVTIVIEAGVLSFIGPMVNPSHRPPPDWAMAAVGLWNALPSNVAPIAIAALMAIIAMRQRMAMRWVFLGAVTACIVGAFQQLSFSDNGYHGELSFQFALAPPFPHSLIVLGLERTALNLAITAGGLWAVSRLGVLRLPFARPLFSE